MTSSVKRYSNVHIKCLEISDCEKEYFTFLGINPVPDMLIDFCHYSVGSAIKTDKVSFDGYEIGNLVASNLQQKNKGFLSDHFVKPPVNITVQFPCNISVDRVVIDPVIGQQRSHDIKIFTATNRITDTWLYGGSNTTVQNDGLIFNQVGYISQTNPTVVCLQNRRFQDRRQWKSDGVCRYNVTGELRSNKPGALTNASHINICVLRTKSGCSAAVKRLEIWGVPASAVPNDLQEKLKKCYIEAVFPSPSLQVNSTTNKQQIDNKTHEIKTFKENEQSSDDTDSVIVPEDFKDEITWEIMACPVVLPSGKIVDQSTLDRFINIEASWGRPPSDPFTGLEFTQGRQPVPNAALKTRIDDFTFKHADLLTVAKTLGRADRGSAGSVTTSRLTSGHQIHKHLTASPLSLPTPYCLKQKGAGNTTGLAVDSTFTSSDVSKFQASLPSRKRKYTGSGSSYDRVETKESKLDKPPKLLTKALNNSTSNGSFTSVGKDTITALSATNNCVESHLDHRVPILSSRQTNRNSSSKQSASSSLKTHTHSSALTCSLDDALKDALGGLPSFTVKVNKDSTLGDRQEVSGGNSELKPNSDYVCSKCGLDCKDSTVIKYRLSCCHLVCRNCVHNESKGQMTCSVCKVNYSREELVRVF